MPISRLLSAIEVPASRGAADPDPIERLIGEVNLTFHSGRMQVLLRMLAPALAIVVFNAHEAHLQAKVVDDEIILGAVLSSSGKYITNGTNAYNGYEFARKLINERGGISVSGKKYTLKIQYVDDKSNSSTARREAERLIVEDGIKFMLGPYSSEMTKAVARVTEYYRIPMVEAEGAALDLFNRGYRYIFGLLSTCENYLDDFIDLTVANEYAADREASQLKLAIAVQNERFSLCVRAAVLARARAHGMEIVLDEKLPSPITSMTAFLSKAADASPDVLVVSGHSIGAEIAVRQMSEMSVHVPYVAITHCEAAGVADRYPLAAEGIYCPAQWAPELDYRDGLFGTALDFSNAMKAAYPDQYVAEVPYQAASAAAAVLVWKDAFERANDASFNTETLRRALSETDLQTFYGRIIFAPTGQIVSKPMVLRQIRDGQFVIVK